MDMFPSWETYDRWFKTGFLINPRSRSQVRPASSSTSRHRRDRCRATSRPCWCCGEPRATRCGQYRRTVRSKHPYPGGPGSDPHPAHTHTRTHIHTRTHTDLHYRGGGVLCQRQQDGDGGVEVLLRLHPTHTHIHTRTHTRTTAIVHRTCNFSSSLSNRSPKELFFLPPEQIIYPSLAGLDVLQILASVSDGRHLGGTTRARRSWSRTSSTASRRRLTSRHR